MVRTPPAAESTPSRRPAPGNQGWNPAKSTCVHPPQLQVSRGSHGAERVKAQAKGVMVRTTRHPGPMALGSGVLISLPSCGRVSHTCLSP